MYSVIVSFVLFQNHAGKILVRSCSFNLFFWLLLFFLFKFFWRILWFCIWIHFLFIVINEELINLPEVMKHLLISFSAVCLRV
jgi:hypothetical protein